MTVREFGRARLPPSRAKGWDNPLTPRLGGSLALPEMVWII